MRSAWVPAGPTYPAFQVLCLPLGVYYVVDCDAGPDDSCPRDPFSSNGPPLRVRTDSGWQGVGLGPVPEHLQVLQDKDKKYEEYARQHGFWSIRVRSKDGARSRTMVLDEDGFRRRHRDPLGMSPGTAALLDCLEAWGRAGGVNYAVDLHELEYASRLVI